MKIHQVSTRRDLNTFINFPYHFYKGDPVWIPPLRSELKSQFDPKRNPFHEHCESSLFLLEEHG